MATLLFRLAPVAVVPLHEHTGVELTYVLEGSLEDEERECTAGNFVWRLGGNTHEAQAPGGALLLGVFTRPNHFAAGQMFFTEANPGQALSVGLPRQGGIGGAFELHRLCMQPGNPCAERVEAAAVALQAGTEARDDRAEVGERAAPRSNGGTLPGDGVVQPDERSPQPFLTIAFDNWLPAQRKGNDLASWRVRFGHGLHSVLAEVSKAQSVHKNQTNLKI
jgi:hypothetical protein